MHFSKFVKGRKKFSALLIKPRRFLTCIPPIVFLIRRINDGIAQRHGWDQFIPRVEADAFAKSTAKNATFIPDKLLVNPHDAPPLNYAEAWHTWTNQSTEFDSVAAKDGEVNFFSVHIIWRLPVYFDIRLRSLMMYSTQTKIFCR